MHFREYKEVKTYMDNTVQQACNTIQNDKDETLLDMSCKDNMELILETRLLQTFVKP